jgi:hypothetical protein
MTYNEMRKQPDRCSSCGKWIGNNQEPRLCSECYVRQVDLRKYRKRIYKTRKPYNKLREYKVPTEEWRLFLYEESRTVGIKALAKKIGIPYSSLLKYIFETRKPITKNRNLIINYFRGQSRKDLIKEM